MLVPPLHAVYFLCVSLSLYVLAFLLYRQDPHSPEIRVMAVITVVLGAVSLAFASLLWMESNLAAQAHARSYAEAQMVTPARER